MARKFVKAVMTVIVLLLLFTLVIGYQSKKHLVRYCREMTAGTSLVDAKEKARQFGLGFYNYSSVEHKAYVTSSGVMGRYVCEIDHAGKRVVKTRLNLND